MTEHHHLGFKGNVWENINLEPIKKQNKELKSRGNIDLSSEVALNPFPGGSGGKNLPAVHKV